MSGRPQFTDPGNAITNKQNHKKNSRKRDKKQRKSQ